MESIPCTTYAVTEGATVGITLDFQAAKAAATEGNSIQRTLHTFDTIHEAVDFWARSGYLEHGYRRSSSFRQLIPGTEDKISASLATLEVRIKHNSVTHEMRRTLKTTLGLVRNRILDKLAPQIRDACITLPWTAEEETRFNGAATSWNPAQSWWIMDCRRQRASDGTLRDPRSFPRSQCSALVGFLAVDALSWVIDAEARFRHGRPPPLTPSHIQPNPIRFHTGQVVLWTRDSDPCTYKPLPPHEQNSSIVGQCMTCQNLIAPAWTNYGERVYECDKCEHFSTLGSCIDCGSRVYPCFTPEGTRLDRCSKCETRFGLLGSDPSRTGSRST